MDLSQPLGADFEMLAVDSGSFGQVAWFREDFADRSLDSLLSDLSVEGPQGLELPADAVTIGVRLRADRLQPTLTFNARLRNARDEHSNIILGTLTRWGPFVGPQERLGSTRA